MERGLLPASPSQNQGSHKDFELTMHDATWSQKVTCYTRPYEDMISLSVFMAYSDLYG